MVTTLAQTGSNSGNSEDVISFQDPMNRLSREERFRAAVYAMSNDLSS